MPEYCRGYGIEFNGLGDFVPALEELMANYSELVGRMSKYPWTAEQMTRQWIELFEKLLHGREKIVAGRRLWRDPLKAIINQVL